MEKRIGTITLLVRDRSQVPLINQLLSESADIIMCRQGMPMPQRSVAVIVLIVEGSSDRINALSGSLGRIRGVEAKAVLTKKE